MSLHSSLTPRPLMGLALAIHLLPARALAGPAGPTGVDDPVLDPRLAIDPRIELDPRLDLPEAARSARPGSPLRAPVSFSISASYQQLAPTGVPVYGGMLFLGLPLERLAARGVREAISAGPSGGAPSTPATGKLDLAPPPPPPKLTAPASAVPEPPLKMPVVVTPSAARAAVDAALRRARRADPDGRIDALAARARRSAGLPELRLRVLRTVDDGQTLSPVSYDPTRIVAVDAITFWLEARATWRLDRLLFAEEEIKLERLRREHAEAQTRLTNQVLKLLFEWQRARAIAANATLPPEENLAARLKATEAEAEIDLLTDGWFAGWKVEQGY